MIFRYALVSAFLLLNACFATFPVPGSKEGETKYIFNGNDIEILGPVSMKGEVVVILGYFVVGPDDFGYVPLLNKARNELGADSVIDVVVDRHALNLLGFLFARVEWRASGTAIRYRDNLRATPRPGTPAAEAAAGAQTDASAASVTKSTSAAVQMTKKPANKASAPSNGGKQSDAVADNGFSFGLRAAYAWPSGTLAKVEGTSIAIPLDDAFESQVVPGWVDIGYRIDKHHYVGAYGALGLPKRECEQQWVTGSAVSTTTTVEDCKTMAYRFGLNYNYRIATGSSLAPWFGIGFGSEIITVEQTHVHTIDLGGLAIEPTTNKVTGSLFGLEGNLQAGLDFITTGSFGIGPFAAIAAGQYLSYKLPGPPNVEISPSGMHYWLFAGVRVVNR